MQILNDEKIFSSSDQHFYVMLFRVCFICWALKFV